MIGSTKQLDPKSLEEVTASVRAHLLGMIEGYSEHDKQIICAHITSEMLAGILFTNPDNPQFIKAILDQATSLKEKLQRRLQ